MNHFRPPNHVRKTCALIAAALILPVLAHAQSAASIRPEPVPVKPVPAVPEANPGLV